MEIRSAREAEFDSVRGFYHSLIDAMRDDEFKPLWQKDIYPTSQFLFDSIRRGELRVGLEGGAVASAMVVNRRCNEGYRGCRWKVRADESRVSVLHALGVHPRFKGRGLAKEMVAAAIGLTREGGSLALRLDVLPGNLPAVGLYRAMGFACMGTARMYYEDTGWTDFLLYEYEL